ncbi:hypothetical protein COCCADRAFT_8273 [Bipolaris zeicola 26-R-13]|uniref:Uncharacterized protein n=1 Tax=Cochliobolus carbonum (strain 26-R-13) TaxID=930089 RepID=W6Y344_COCC2|nr:uncharacterized protein COCCADRAFT_8273 [Bipolaris zeicola 26-R-13]EUC29519.1 hypothetical protein COCCADRAFT_8273 [Bipolaris zeicola 26-R-13]
MVVKVKPPHPRFRLDLQREPTRADAQPSAIDDDEQVPAPRVKCKLLPPTLFAL